jgi:hypothetical protein
MSKFARWKEQLGGGGLWLWLCACMDKPDKAAWGGRPGACTRSREPATASMGHT